MSSLLRFEKIKIRRTTDGLSQQKKPKRLEPLSENVSTERSKSFVARRSQRFGSKRKSNACDDNNKAMMLQKHKKLASDSELDTSGCEILGDEEEVVPAINICDNAGDAVEQLLCDERVIDLESECGNVETTVSSPGFQSDNTEAYIYYTNDEGNIVNYGNNEENVEYGNNEENVEYGNNEENVDYGNNEENVDSGNNSGNIVKYGVVDPLHNVQIIDPVGVDLIKLPSPDDDEVESGEIFSGSECDVIEGEVPKSKEKLEVVDLKQHCEEIIGTDAEDSSIMYQHLLLTEFQTKPLFRNAILEKLLTDIVASLFIKVSIVNNKEVVLSDQNKMPDDIPLEPDVFDIVPKVRRKRIMPPPPAAKYVNDSITTLDPPTVNVGTTVKPYAPGDLRQKLDARRQRPQTITTIPLVQESYKQVDAQTENQLLPPPVLATQEQNMPKLSDRANKSPDEYFGTSLMLHHSTPRQSPPELESPACSRRRWKIEEPMRREQVDVRSKNPSSRRFVRGSPLRTVHSSSRNIRSPSRNIRSPSRNIRSPSRTRRSPSRTRRSPSRTRRSPSRTRRSQLCSCLESKRRVSSHSCKFHKCNKLSASHTACKKASRRSRSFSTSRCVEKPSSCRRPERSPSSSDSDERSSSSFSSSYSHEKRVRKRRDSSPHDTGCVRKRPKHCTCCSRHEKKSVCHCDVCYKRKTCRIKKRKSISPPLQTSRPPSAHRLPFPGGLLPIKRQESNPRHRRSNHAAADDQGDSSFWVQRESRKSNRGWGASKKSNRKKRANRGSVSPRWPNDRFRSSNSPVYRGLDINHVNQVGKFLKRDPPV